MPNEDGHSLDKRPLLRGGPSRAQYTPASVTACEKTLRSLLSNIGPWGPRVVLIGGMAPRYLVPDVQLQVGAHIGTTDLDVVIGVAVEDVGEAYRTLQKNLSDLGFSPSRDPQTGNEMSFRWERKVDGVPVTLEFFCPVGDGIPGRAQRNPVTAAGSKISAIRTRGAELAGEDFIEVDLSGETLDHGGVREHVSLKVANILPLLVLKAFALQEREKDKDAYDVIWLLRSHQGGPRGAAQAAALSPIVDSPEVAAAIEVLRSVFRTHEHSGPSQYARFLADDINDLDDRVRLQRLAHGTMNEFLAHWDSNMTHPGVKDPQ